MIPTPLVAPPAQGREGTRKVWWAGAWLGTVCVAVAVFGAVIWVGGISTLGFTRFSVLEGDRRIDVRQPGTFVVFEEYKGASRAQLPPPLDITVRDEKGSSIPVEKLVEPGQVGAPDAYRDTLDHEGRAIARFTAPAPGTYRLRVQAKLLGTYDPTQYGTRVRGTIALGRDLATTWLGGPIGVVAMVVVPLVIGVSLLVLTRRARRRARRRAEAAAPAPIADPVAALDARRAAREPTGAVR
ncbi:MAG: hypothetical protein U0Q07_06970 [Acidimicrobiales bacterium]